MTGTFRPAALAACVALVSLAAPAAVRAQETPEQIFEAAGKAHHAGNQCLAEGRKNPSKQFIENEKAIGHLEQAQRLLEKYLEMRPDDASAENLMQDTLSLLFWCHKMSPMVDPEEIPEEEPVEDEPEAATPDPAEDEAAKRAAEEEARRKAAEEGAAEAARLLEEARRYAADNPSDGMGALAKFFYVAERFPDTEAGKAAKTEADKLQASLFEVKPVVPAKKKIEPLTDADRSAIESALKSWLLNRQKLRCASCKGAGYSECKKCDGTGKIEGRAGRSSTCSKCKRGKIACSRRTCIEGVDTRMLEKIVIDARAPYYQEKLKALLGDSRDSIELFLQALAAVLANSPRAHAEISRCATELKIEPVQLRDVIENHGPNPDLATPFTSYTIPAVNRKIKYTIRGDNEHEEVVTFEQQDGKWYLRSFK